MGLVVNSLLPVPARRTVRARLVAPVGWYTAAGGGIREAVTVWSTEIADDGSWSLDLPGNASYDAEDTWYRIEEPGAAHAALVPAGGGPFQLHDIAITDPSAPACCPPPPAGSVADGARSLEELLDVEGTDGAVPGDFLKKAVDGFWRPGVPTPQTLGYRHMQSAPATTWQIQHQLGFRPNVTAHTNDDFLISYERIAHPTALIAELTFGVPVAGYADAS